MLKGQSYKSKEPTDWACVAEKQQQIEPLISHWYAGINTPSPSIYGDNCVHLNKSSFYITFPNTVP